MKPRKEQTLRCASYTRKSSEEGLEQDFNSLHAQREACEAYIRSQQGEGWRLRKTSYDDGGLSGATMERPALKQLLADIEEGLVDVVVVYKVDRLTRSLSDFARMVEVFDGHQVSFVAVTQQFNTTTSMGRLTLNVLLSFAQFEREVTGERIRDKIAASKRKGMWMGGLVPIGYEVRDRQLVVVESEAETVRHIFERYCELGSVRLLKEELDRDGYRSKLRIAGDGSHSGDKSFARGALYTLLRNPIYVGEIRHKGARHPGQHQPIVERSVWDRAQELLLAHTVRKETKPGESSPSPLIGKLFDETGEGLTPSHAVKGNRRYRYYVSRSLMKGTARVPGQGWRVPALELERNLANAVARILDEHTAIAADIDEAGVAAHDLTSIFDSTAEWSARLRSEAEAAPALKTLVERAELHHDGIRLAIRLPISNSAKANIPSDILLARQIPLKVKRRGVELRLIIGAGSVSSPRVDSTILKAIARAHRWFDDLVSGRSASMVEIGRREGVSKPYISRMIRLAFLSPAIVERIVDGRQPAELTAQFCRPAAAIFRSTGQIRKNCSALPLWPD
jgi:site-specific DNA recombinase